MLSIWLSLFPHPVCGLAHKAGLRDGKTGLKGKAPLQICVLVRVWWPVASARAAAPELWRKGHMDNGSYAWRAAGEIQLVGKGRSQEAAIAAVQGLPAHPGNAVPGCHPQPPAMGLFLQLCLCFLISPLYSRNLNAAAY